MAIIDGSEDTLTLECCKYCGCLLFMPDYYSRWDVNILRCDGCLIEYFDNEITPKMQKAFSSIQKNITNEDIVYKSANTKEFYEQKSIEQFGTPSRWYELFIKEEVSKLPSYSQHKGKIELSNYYDRQKKNCRAKSKPCTSIQTSRSQMSHLWLREHTKNLRLTKSRRRDFVRDIQ